MAFNKNKVMDAARKFVEKGQTDRAIKEYLKVVDHDPKDVRVWLKIGDLYAKKGAKADATETYLKVAKFYGEQGFYLKAVAVYKQILRLDPRMVEVNLKLAELYRQLGLLSDAMQHFERVAAHFHREGKTQEALATIRQLVDLDPDNVATRIKLAELYSKEEMSEEAIQEFRRACDYLRSHSRQDDFLKVAERLLWHDSSDIALNRELATLYLRRNDARRGLQKLQVCFKADPRDVETLALLAQAFQALDQKSKTVSVLKELARVFTEDGKTSEAEDVHRKILMFAPDDPDSREALGEPPSIRQAAVIPEPSQVIEEVARPGPTGMGNPTGSMPIVQDPDEVEIDGDIDEESDSFVADIAVEDESYQVGSNEVEANADEIVKILTETDVYVKYGLQQKAIDHLHRVFELDVNNVEARERLKDIYVADGNNDDAINELLTLTELVAPQDPDRAELYLSEAAELDPSNPEVQRRAQSLQLELGGGPEVEIVDDLSAQIDLTADEFGTGNVAPVDDEVEFDEIDFGDAGGDLDMSSEANIEPATDDAPEFLTDDQEVGEFELELGSYDGARDPAAPAMGADPDRPITQEVQLDQLEEELSLDDSNVEELSFDDVVEGTNELAVEDLEFDASALEDDPAQELAATFDDPQSLDAAPMDVQDMELPSELPQEPSIAAPIVDAPEHLPPDEDLGLGIDAREPTHTQQTSSDEGGTSLEDDLDEADFFVSQSLFEEAREILNVLLEKYPNHPLIAAKMQDIDAMETGGAEDAAPRAPDDFDSTPIPDDRIEQQLEGEHKSRVKLEHDIADEDADTHFDLGLAYKEMGLYDEAIKSFGKVVNSPNRAVESHMMIGLCQREQGALAEAVQQFKNGLYVDEISDPEKLGLYYEIGFTYEGMEDPGEALYFYEMVHKKDDSHRDIGERIKSVRAACAKNGNSANKKPAVPAGGDDIDAAFDNVLGGNADDISQH